MMRYRSGNHWSCPVVIRVPIGGYLRGGAPYHSQSAVAIFAHTPGSASFSVERAGRRGSAAHGDSLRRPGAVLRAQAPLPADLQQGRVSRAGLHDPVRQGVRPARRHRTSSSSRGARWCSARCWRRSRPSATAISVAVVDLRTIIPYDWDTIAAYTRKTNRVIVAHEDQLTCGFGAEIAARVSRRAVRISRRPGQARRLARLPRRLRAGPRGSHPAGLRRRAEGHQARCAA